MCPMRVAGASFAAGPQGIHPGKRQVVVSPQHAEAVTEADPLSPGPFLLSSSRTTLLGWGATRRWTTPLAAGLPSEVSDALASLPDGSSGIVVGALPFDPDAASHLFLPERTRRMHGAVDLLSVVGLEGAHAALSPASVRIRPDPSPAEYETAVAHALEGLKGARPGAAFENLRKVVLARSLLVDSDAPIELGGLIEALRLDPAASVYSVPLPSRVPGQHRTLVGASPELLLSRQGRSVATMPLAGSRSRHPDPALDRAAAEELQASEKDRREHAAVVESILDGLAPHCTNLRLPDGPSLTSTSSMWHLATRITGDLRDPAPSSLELLASIHPTPAVCGLPVAPARDAIRELEPFDRGFFAGAVGWCDAAGDGEWMLAIRCAEVEGHRARLYAGAGIVTGSDPTDETRETSAKFRTMLRAFGLDSLSPLYAAEP